MSAPMPSPWCWLATALVALAPPAAAQVQEPPPAPPAAADESPQLPSWLNDQWRQALEQLEPADPAAYFLLAEQLMDGAPDRERAELARQLLVLAFELDRQGGGRHGLMASACVALAHLERLEERADWLRALAGAIDRRYAATDWNVPAIRAQPDEVLLNAATVLGLARAGEGIRAARLLEQPGVLDLFRQYEALLGDTGLTGGLVRLRDTIRAWPCPECANERIVPRRGEGPGQYRLCFTCEGNPGPRLTEAEFLAQLRFESRLLSGLHRSWGAQVVADGGAPLRDPDPEAVAATYHVDPGRPYWRDGQWVRQPGP